MSLVLNFIRGTGFINILIAHLKISISVTSGVKALPVATAEDGSKSLLDTLLPVTGSMLTEEYCSSKLK